MRVSVICCIYNAAPLVQRCLAALYGRTNWLGKVEVILVDNCGPDAGSMEAVRHFASHPDFKIVSPGRNLGCHGGWNFGYQHCAGEYVCKLDDDTEIETAGWAPLMACALEAAPACGFLSADIDAKQANRYEIQSHGGENFEVALSGVVGFSLVMFRRADVERWGPMKTGLYRAAGGKRIDTERLYGGEEVHYARCAQAEGKFIAHFPAVKCHHMDNFSRDPDYAMWKYAYGFRGWTDKDLIVWRASGEHVKHYCQAIQVECRATPNDALLLDWVTRLGDIGNRDHMLFIELARQKSENGKVKEACIVAHRKIMEHGA